MTVLGMVLVLQHPYPPQRVRSERKRERQRVREKPVPCVTTVSAIDDGCFLRGFFFLFSLAPCATTPRVVDFEIGFSAVQSALPGGGEAPAGSVPHLYG